MQTIKYMLTSTQLANAETFAFVAVLVFQLLSCKILFINRKDNRNCKKNRLVSKKIAYFIGKLLQNYK